MTNILPLPPTPDFAADAPDHAPWSPSSMSRLIPCNASVGAVEIEPRDEFSKSAAQFGTEIHEWILTPNGTNASLLWTDERLADAKLCLADYEKHVPADAHKEVKVFSLYWPKLLFGTIDALWSEDNKCIDIADLKTGLCGVNAADNYQLLTYASIVSEHFPAAESFRLHIIQPRRWYYDCNVYTRQQIAEFQTKIATAIESRANFVAGPHCQFCPSRSVCSTLESHIFSLIDEAKELELWTPTGLTITSDFCE